MKILLLEDDRLFNETLSDFLEDSGFEVDSVLDPYSAYDLTYKKRYDIYLFDINLPFEDGISALSSLRDSGDNTPTIFITSREDKDSLVKGFRSGADDYIKKPFDLDELLLRINAILKRDKKFEDKIELASLRVDLNKRKVYIDNKEINITTKPYELLLYLIQNDNRVVEYDELYKKLWSDDEVSYASLRVYISELKGYLGSALENIRGVGYIFDSSKLK